MITFTAAGLRRGRTRKRRFTRSPTSIFTGVVSTSLKRCLRLFEPEGSSLVTGSAGTCVRHGRRPGTLLPAARPLLLRETRASGRVRPVTRLRRERSGFLSNADKVRASTLPIDGADFPGLDGIQAAPMCNVWKERQSRTETAQIPTGKPPCRALDAEEVAIAKVAERSEQLLTPRTRAREI